MHLIISLLTEERLTEKNKKIHYVWPIKKNMNSLGGNREVADKDILEAIKAGDREVFGMLYDRYAAELLHYIYGFTKNKEVSEDILQEILINIWDRRDSIAISESLRNYLYGAARYAALSYIRSEEVKRKYAEHFLLFRHQNSYNPTEDLANLKDLEEIISSCMDTLPPKCKTVFYQSRFQHKSIQEIAQDMQISTRTVENYISSGIRHIKHILKNYSWSVAMLMHFIFRA